jgi:hypothetical protein
MDAKLISDDVSFALDSHPSYRVQFMSGEKPDPDAEFWRLTSTITVREALDWAEDHRESRGYALYAEWEDLEGSLALIRLTGNEPPAR